MGAGRASRLRAGAGRWASARTSLRLGLLAPALLLGSLGCGPPAEPARLNVLWIAIDDQSPWSSSYGDSLIETPNLDALAEAGVLFERAYAANPVCSPSRSALITGSYPIRLGTHDHRSSRVPENAILLPQGFLTVPELFRQAGYETYNAAKDDYNFVYRRSDLYTIGVDETDTVAKNWKGPVGGGDWRDVPDGASFFGQMSVSGGKRVDDMVAELRGIGLAPVDPSRVRVPEQYPDIPLVREHIANHYNSILRTDHELGRVVARLKADGLWQNTVLFVYSDHGSDLPRSKEFCYVEGLHVPLIVVAPGLPEVVPSGSRRGDLVSLMDVAATSLALAGLDVPETMDSRDVFSPSYGREHVYSSADRMSNVIDRVRSVVGNRYHYIRNFMTDRPLMNWGHREMIGLTNPEASSFLAIRSLAQAGELTAAQAAPYGPRVAEELYDLHNDPDEVHNLAASPAHRAQLEQMRERLESWLLDTGDRGQFARSEGAMLEITERFPPDWLRSPEFEAQRLEGSGDEEGDNEE